MGTFIVSRRILLLSNGKTNYAIFDILAVVVGVVEVAGLCEKAPPTKSMTWMKIAKIMADKRTMQFVRTDWDDG